MINSEGPVGDGNGQSNGLSPGKRLSQGRLQLGLTQEQVAKELYITLVKIKALESDDYGRLNTDTFIRGYIRAYANLIKVDVVEVLAAYDQLLQERGQSPSQSDAVGSALQPRAQTAAASSANAPGATASAISSPSRGALQLLLVIAAFFLGLWLISVWFFNHQPDKNYTALSPVVSLYASSGESASSNEATSSETSSVAAVTESRTQSSPVLASSQTAQSSAVSTKNRSASSSSLALAAVQASSQNALEASSAEASSLAAAKPKATGLDTINFSFRAECWLEVSDSRGDVLATELQAAGSSLTLVGKAPFDVKLGNAPAVAIQLNTKQIDVIPLLGSNVLTLRVSE